jgi:hypothetical protein
MRRLSLSARELRGQLVVLALALWAVAIVNATGPGRYLRSGQIKGTDFVQFYTLGRLAHDGRVTGFADFDAIRETQLAAVPESHVVYFPPVYGPQVPLALAPLGFFSYEGALLVWILVTAAVYLWLMFRTASALPALQAHVGLVLLAAVAYPPFWQLIQHGQLTIVAIAALAGAWFALRRDRPWLAGACLGILAYKPPLLAPAAAVLLLAGEWRMLASAGLVAAGQLVAASVWVGLTGLRDYVMVLVSLPAMANQLETRPAQTHAWRGFWALIVPDTPWEFVLFFASAAATIVLAARIWRRQPDPALRMAVLALAIALAAPYLFVYDLAILAPAWLWLVDWFLRRPELSAWVGRALYVGYIAALFGPLAAATRLQISVPVLAFLLWSIWRSDYRAVNTT